MAQRILSPLRLPFRHIGADAAHSKRVIRPAKMNFIIHRHVEGFENTSLTSIQMSIESSGVVQLCCGRASRVDGQRFVVHADEKLTAFLELELAIRWRYLLEAKNVRTPLAAFVLAIIAAAYLNFTGQKEDAKFLRHVVTGISVFSAVAMAPYGRDSIPYSRKVQLRSSARKWENAVR